MSNAILTAMTTNPSDIVFIMTKDDHILIGKGLNRMGYANLRRSSKPIESFKAGAGINKYWFTALNSLISEPASHAFLKIKVHLY